MPRGVLTLIAGNMFAGKTDDLMRRVRKIRRYSQKRVLVLKPDVDSRSTRGYIESFDKKRMKAHEVSSAKPETILEVVKREEAKIKRRYGKTSKLDIIAIDEIQFLETFGFIRVVDRLLELGHDVIAAGLAFDFKTERFGATLMLLELAQGNFETIFSFCAKCGRPAVLPQRLVDGEPAPYDSPQILVGGKESYEPRCLICFETPPKTVDSKK